MDESYVPHPCFMTGTRLEGFLQDRTLAIFFGNALTSSLYTYLSYYKHIKDTREPQANDESIRSSQPVKALFMKLVNNSISGLPEIYSFHTWEKMKEATKNFALGDAASFAFHFGRYVSHEQTIAYVMARKMGFTRMLGTEGAENITQFQSRSLGGKSVSFYFSCNALYNHWNLPSYVAHLAEIFVRLDSSENDATQTVLEYNEALDDIERITGKSEKYVALTHAVAYFISCPSNRRTAPEIELDVPEKRWIGRLMYQYFDECSSDSLGDSDRRFETYCMDTVAILSELFYDGRLLDEEYSRVSGDDTDWWQEIVQK